MTDDFFRDLAVLLARHGVTRLGSEHCDQPLTVHFGDEDYEGGSFYIERKSREATTVIGWWPPGSDEPAEIELSELSADGS